MRHRGRVRDQRFHPTERLAQRTHPHFFQHLPGIRKRTRLESNHGAETGHLPLGQFVLWVIRQSRITNFLHFFVLVQKLRDHPAVLVVLFHSYSERLHSAQYEPALEWRQYGACRLLHESQLFHLLCSCTDHHPAKPITVAIEKLRRGVNYHVCTQRNRLLEIRRHESVVHY